MRISDWSSDVCSSDLIPIAPNYGFDQACTQSAALSAPISLADSGAVRFAAFGGTQASSQYNGKLERPRILSRPVVADEVAHICRGEAAEGVFADWDFSANVADPSRILDAGPHGLHGRLTNLPARAMIGSNWTGEETSWRHAPDQYGAIHFHDDDMYDCAWDTDFSFTVPTDLRSGVYAMRLACEAVVAIIPFFVRPRRAPPQS